jgi:myo-inositol-1-phosphate synthase
MKIKDVIELLNPTDLVFGGWDINSDNLVEAMRKAQVFDYELQKKLE